MLVNVQKYVSPVILLLFCNIGWTNCLTQVKLYLKYCPNFFYSINYTDLKILLKNNFNFKTCFFWRPNVDVNISETITLSLISIK